MSMLHKTFFILCAILCGGVSRIDRALGHERHRWFLWIPVAIAIGIMLYAQMGWPSMTFSWLSAPGESLKESVRACCTWPGWRWLPVVLAALIILPDRSLERIKGVGPLNSVELGNIKRFLLWASLWVALGFFTISWDKERGAHSISRPCSSWIAGVVTQVDHPASRTRLFQRVLMEVRDAEVPSIAQGCIWLTIRTPCVPLHQGDTIKVMAKMSPIAPPLFPTAYNPRYEAFFRAIVAKGFALTSPKILSRQLSFWSHARNNLTRRIHAVLPAPLGAMGCAFITGDKMALPPEVRQEFSDSGLAHLLAIAGLHVSLLAWICMLFFRKVAGWLLPGDEKGYGLFFAALASLAVSWMYLMLSGQRIPIQRAFFMAFTAILALLVGKSRHPLRLLMVCGALFLVFHGHFLWNLSYQLSFVTVAGLLSFYEGRRGRWRREKPLILHPLWGKPRAISFYHWVRLMRLGHEGTTIFPTYQKIRWAAACFQRDVKAHILSATTVLIGGRHSWRYKLFQKIRKKGARVVPWMRHHSRDSIYASLVITLCSGPIMMYHFHHISFQGLIANFMAIPFTACVIMPLGLLAAVLAFTPLGGMAITLWGFSLKLLLFWNHWCAQNLKALIVASPPYSSGLLTLYVGALFWALLWRKSWRHWGTLVALIALCSIFAFPEKPMVLIHPLSGRLAFWHHKSRVFYSPESRRGRAVLSRWVDAFHGKKVEGLPPIFLILMPGGARILLVHAAYGEHFLTKGADAFWRQQWHSGNAWVLEYDPGLLHKASFSVNPPGSTLSKSPGLVGALDEAVSTPPLPFAWRDLREGDTLVVWDDKVESQGEGALDAFDKNSTAWKSLRPYRHVLCSALDPNASYSIDSRGRFFSSTQLGPWR